LGSKLFFTKTETGVVSGWVKIIVPLDGYYQSTDLNNYYKCLQHIVIIIDQPIQFRSFRLLDASPYQFFLLVLFTIHWAWLCSLFSSRDEICGWI